MTLQQEMQELDVFVNQLKAQRLKERQDELNQEATALVMRLEIVLSDLYSNDPAADGCLGACFDTLREYIDPFAGEDDEE